MHVDFLLIRHGISQADAVSLSARVLETHLRLAVIQQIPN